MSRARRYLLMVAVASAVAAGLCMLLLSDEEPKYQGKRLSEWVEVYGDHWSEATRGKRAEADDAIKQMGTNALPYLLKWVMYDVPSWKSTVYGLVNSILTRWNPAWELTHQYHWGRVLASWKALSRSERLAKEAVPILIRTFDNPSTYNDLKFRAAWVLFGLGETGVQPMLDRMRMKNDVERGQLSALFVTWPSSSNALPALKKALDDPNEKVRKFAADSIFHMEAFGTARD